MANSINRDWFIKSVIFSAIFSVILFFASHDLTFSFFMFFGFIIVINIYLLYIRCPHCGNLGALHVQSTKLLNSNQSQYHFTKYEAIGHSVSRNCDGEPLGTTTHYQHVPYIKTITTYNYEDTIVCQYCRAVSKKQYQKQSYETHRA